MIIERKDLDELLDVFQTSGLKAMEYEEADYRLRFESDGTNTGNNMNVARKEGKNSDQHKSSGKNSEQNEDPDEKTDQNEDPDGRTDLNKDPDGRTDLNKDPDGKTDQNKDPDAKKALTEIVSPVVGVFYDSPAPDDESYVNEGQTVKEGDIICMIEAMKLMNEIKAQSECRIIRKCVNSGDMVEFGTVLFEVEKC